MTVLTGRQIFSVSEITKNIRYVLEENFSSVWVEGEISNFKFHTSGHMYFSLKDEFSQIQCVMFRSDNAKLDFEPKEGLSIVCFGRVSVYPMRGQVQLYAEKMEPKGLGALQLKFQELKEKLKKEGLFDEARKREIPYLPNRIGIVTSIDGAALKDILNVLHRRFSTVSILIHPAQVQGAAAAASIAEAIEDFNRLKNVDVLIIGRGGGSLEDLWAFNEEIVARAIFNSLIPVISAVGHEVDFTISDFVADLRAATPSAAAEIVTPMKEELILRISDLKLRILQAFTGFVKNLRQELKALQQSRGLKDPLSFFEIKFQRLSGLIGQLEALGPLSTLKRGYSATFKLPGETLVTSFDSVKPGDFVKTRLKKGFFTSQVKEAHA